MTRPLIEVNPDLEAEIREALQIRCEIEYRKLIALGEWIVVARCEEAADYLLTLHCTACHANHEAAVCRQHAHIHLHCFSCGMGDLHATGVTKL